MTASPRGIRLHIGVFGKRNAGKSSLVNALAGQQVSIVSDIPGTTTDPVEKALEFAPLGPAVLIDTAGLDDEGELGALRAERSRAIVDRTDLALIAFDEAWGNYEHELHEAFAKRATPVVAVRTKTDVDGATPDTGESALPDALAFVAVSALTGSGLEDLRQAVIAATPEEFIESPPIARDLVPPGATVVLVTPIDAQAPRGRLILPQVQTIRDLLDGECVVVVCKESACAEALNGLKTAPALVVTDSQVFRLVADVVGEDIPLTGFSILLARSKGNLAGFAAGAAAIDLLRDGDRILVAESCTHHRAEDDIGRVKLPAMIRKKTGAHLEFSFVSGHDFPENISDYALVLHCGACMTNRRAILSRQAQAASTQTPVVNYGIAIAHCFGLLERALAPFPEALAAFQRSVPKAPAG